MRAPGDRSGQSDAARAEDERTPVELESYFRLYPLGDDQRR
jgi:hypothetical protein